jgi:hypothetical protein
METKDKSNFSSAGRSGFIYNITMNIHWSVHEEWLQWMQQVYISSIISTGCFENYHLARLIDVDETDGPTYTIQCYAATKALYERYIELHASAIQQAAIDKWGDKFFSFTSVMQIVH